MNIFDIIGPVMIGPSSSHTAGAVRIGYIARLLLSEEVKRADIVFHGSFAKTYKGHGTDKAVIAGIMGMLPDDERIRKSLEIAKKNNIEINISCEKIDGAHPNTVKMALYGVYGRALNIQGSSVGGGNILITNIDGLEVSITGQQNTLIVVHKDTPGMIAAVTDYMSKKGINIANFKLTRLEKGGTAIMTIEIEGNNISDLNETIEKIDGVIHSTFLKTV